MKPIRTYIRYRLNRPTKEMLKGLRMLSSRTGWPVYTGQSIFSRGGYTPTNVPPRFDPKRNIVET